MARVTAKAKDAEKDNKKYWENEDPLECNLGINRFKNYVEAGKLQIYRIMANTRSGLSTGATIALDEMDEKELKSLVKVIQAAVTAELEKRGEEDEEEEKPKKKKKLEVAKKKKGN